MCIRAKKMQLILSFQHIKWMKIRMLEKSESTAARICKQIFILHVLICNSKTGHAHVILSDISRAPLKPSTRVHSHSHCEEVREAWKQRRCLTNAYLDVEVKAIDVIMLTQL